MDQGMTAGVGTYFDNMQRRFRRDVPPIAERSTASTIAAFVNDMFTDSSVTKPVDDLYLGAHAGGDGFLFCTLFRGQVNVLGDPTDVTDFEVLDQAMKPARPAKIPDSLVGYTRATPDPPPTHSVHIKGCNIGRDRFHITAGQPKAPFLTKMKQAFGDNVKVTAPKHFHGLIEEINHKGIFEYMEQELIVRTKAVKIARGGFRGFATRQELIDAYKAAHLTYHDGTPIPDADWGTTLVPALFADNRRIAMTLPLGRTVEHLTSLTIHKQLRIELEQVDWTITPGGTIPTAPADQLALLRASIAADDRFKATHPWPVYERRGFADFNAYMDGHLWTFAINGNVLVCKGRRYDYTIVLPIVDRTVSPPANRPLIFNFYPGVGSPDAPILTGFDETNDRFFGRS